MAMSTSAARFTDAQLDDLAQELDRDGATVIRGLLDPALIAEWKGAFDRLYAERKGRTGGLAPRETARYYLTLPWVPPFADPVVFANPVVRGVLDRVFAQEYVMVQLGADVPEKGSEYQEIHRDYRTLFTEDFVTPLYALAVNVPLVEVTAENGPFEMARGTHRMTREEGLRKVESGEVPMEPLLMQPGDVSIRTPLQLHRGTPNRTDQPRPNVVMGYAMHWLHTPKVDLTLERPYYESLPEDVRAMLRCTVVDQLEDKPESYLEFKF